MLSKFKSQNDIGLSSVQNDNWIEVKKKKKGKLMFSNEVVACKSNRGSLLI